MTPEVALARAFDCGPTTMRAGRTCAPTRSGSQLVVGASIPA
jgi:hypothetical protein